MIERSNDHIYRDGNKKYLSVTQHLVISGKVDFSMVSAHDLQYACNRGNNVHEAIRLYLSDDLDMTKKMEGYIGYVEAFIRFCREHNLQVWDTEGIIKSDRLMTAGAFDFVGAIGDRKKLAPAYLFEIKTSSTMPLTAPYQVAGYVKLWNECKENKIYGGYGLHLKANGTYRLYKYDLIKYGRKFETMVRANWDALADGIIPLAAKSQENIHALCKSIIKG